MLASRTTSTRCWPTALALGSNAPGLRSVWQLQLDSCGASTFAFFFFGDTMVGPGVDLTSVGARGCSADTTASLGAFPNLFAVETSQTNLLPPSTPSLIGSGISAQGTAAMAATALTIATPKGLSGVVRFEGGWGLRP